MTIIDLLDVWNLHTKNLIKINIDKHQEYSDFVKEQSTNKHFWYAMLWMLSLHNEYSYQAEKPNMEDFFNFVDQHIKNHPDCFKDKTTMLAHELLWKFGAKEFYEAIFNVNTMLSELDRFIKQ